MSPGREQEGGRTNINNKPSSWYGQAIYFCQILPRSFHLNSFYSHSHRIILGRLGFRIWFGDGFGFRTWKWLDSNTLTRSRSQVWLILSQEECQQIIRQSDNIRSRLMRRLLSVLVGAVCLANCEGLPRIYDKTNPIFFISPSGAGAGSRRGREGKGRRPAWSTKLELDQKHLEIHCYQPRAF